MLFGDMDWLEQSCSRLDFLVQLNPQENSPRFHCRERNIALLPHDLNVRQELEAQSLANPLDLPESAD